MSIITIEPGELSIDSENFVYSKTSSRPSKSIVNPELYTKYKSIKDVFSFFDGKCNCDYLIRECLNYVFSNMQKIESLPTRSLAIIRNNDIVMVSRATPGKTFKATLISSHQPLVAASSVYIIRITSSKVLPKYLLYILNSKSFRRLPILLQMLQILAR